MPDEIIVIGAGASGLMAARELSAQGKFVRVVEARDRTGGRIHTVSLPGFSTRIEGGAEFIHGKLQHTEALIREAGLSYHRVEGEIYNARHGVPHKQSDFIEDQKTFLKKLEQVEGEISIQQFLNQNFKEDKYEELRDSILGYVQGYELADPENASVYLLRDEWLSNEKEEDQYRIDPGYGAIINFLKEKCDDNGCRFHFDTIIKSIAWRKNEVRLTTADNHEFSANKVIISIPLGILKADHSHKASIRFTPALATKFQAIQALGFGQTIKFILEFNEPFWESKHLVRENAMKQLGFVFGDAIVPTWWTQAPIRNAILTGWLGGPPVNQWKDLNDESLLQLATDSLSTIFKIDHAVLVEKIVASKVFNWSKDDFTLGGYTYYSLNREKFLDVLSTPEDDTLFFCGEALERNASKLGTVEAALASGAEVAQQVLQAF